MSTFLSSPSPSRIVVPTERRWFGVGLSAGSNAAGAGTEAAATAAGGRDAALLLVFASASYDFAALLDGVRSQVGSGTHIVGCSSGGQVFAGGPTDDSVAVIALGGPGFRVQTGVSRDVVGRHREAGMEAAASLEGLEAPHRVLLLLVDGLIGRHQEVIRGAYSMVGAGTPLVGGCAADDARHVRTCQFVGTGAGVEVLSNAVVSVALGSDAPLGIGIGHGWRKSGEPMIVTNSSDGRIYEFDGEPALDVYLQRTGGEASLLEDPRAFHLFAYDHPLGLSRRSGEDVRVPSRFDLTDRSLLCLADVPQGALAWLLTADGADLVRGADEAVAGAITMLGDHAPLGVVTFDCIIRRTKLGTGGVEREIAQFTRSTADAPFAGFYTYGEIARTRGTRGLHHLSVVALAFA